MVRAVAPYRPPARNEDLAIVSFNPLPNNEMQFAAVRAVLRDFLHHERPTAFLDIQPTHLGQALVQFAHAYDRDELIAQSPIVFGDVSVSFCKHNQGRNWRIAQFHHECWLLVLGLPNDYWTERHIHGAIGEFARVLHFEADPRQKCRLLIRARVTDLEMIPQFIVYSDPDSVNGDSWTLQCEILQQVQQNHQQAPPEEEIPNELNMEPIIPFDFFGLGQPIDGNNGLLDLNQNAADIDVQAIQPNNVQDEAQQLNLAWDPWAPWPEVQQ